MNLPDLLGHVPRARTRRQFLLEAGGGFGAFALAHLLARDGYAATGGQADARSANPLAARKPHFPGTAKSVIFMFMVGGPSPIDLFDPKPQLRKHQGKPLPASFGKPVSQFTNGETPLLASTRTFARHGKSGMEVSDLMPHLATCVDDIAFLRSCWCTSTIHAPAMYELHSGRTIMGYPSLGSWVTYGLGTDSDNLPAYCVMLQPEGTPEGGAPCWGSAFLPAVYQGTLLRNGSSPLLNLQRPAGVSERRQRSTLDFLKQLNENELDPGDSERTCALPATSWLFACSSTPRKPST